MSYGSAAGGFIYIRVPRTGSTSFLVELNQQYPDIEQRGTQHVSAAEAVDLWPEWHDRQTFGFIRNPWDWLVSVYNAGLSVTARQKIKEQWPGSRVSPPDAPGIHPGQRTMATFPEWVRNRQTTPLDWLYGSAGPLVDEIRRFEDFIPTAKVKRSDVAHAPYTEWYGDDLAEYVAVICAKEIEIGNYSFGQ